jgi:hypothetical protein
MTSPSETVSLMAGSLIQVSARQYSLSYWVVKGQVYEGGLKGDSKQKTYVENPLGVSYLNKSRCKE